MQQQAGVGEADYCTIRCLLPCIYFLKVSMMRAPPSWAVDSPLQNSTLNLPDLPKEPMITPVSPLAVTTCSMVHKTCPCTRRTCILSFS